MAKSGRLEAVTLLLEVGCAIDAADYDTRTCLHLAASTGNLPICQLLLDRGATVNAKDRWGGTPLRDAVREGRAEVAVLLRGKGGELGYDEVAAAGELCELQPVESAVYPVRGQRPICLLGLSKGSGRSYAPQSAA